MILAKALRFQAAWLVLMLAACGDSGEQARTDGGDQTPGDGAVDEDGGPNDDGGTRSDAGDGGGRDDGGSCLTTCAADDCGSVPTGCGAFLECGTCGQGLVCGQYADNKCGAPPPVPCTPKTPQEACSGKCGAVSDGCSDVIQCGSENGGIVCGTGQSCTNSVCKESGVATCTVRETCETKHHTCGQDGDGCGDTLDCGTCPTGKQCQYDAVNGNRCVDSPTPCQPIGIVAACTGACGLVGDGCGGQLDCESSVMTACPTGQSCGGAGVPGQCGTATQTCTPIAANVACAGKCGVQSDGCGGVYTCSAENGGQTCNAALGETCGGAGVINQCGAPPCVPKTTAEACPGSGGMKSCGQQPNGCGGLIDCGGCDAGQQCGLFQASICGTIPTCAPTPIGTACANKCGSVPDGCGGSYSCNGSNGGVTCTGTQYCGANNQPNTCGDPPVTCVAKTCAQLGHTCGLASDGCGKVLNCWPSCAANDPTCNGSCGADAACLANPTTGAQTCVVGTPTCTGSLCSTVPTSCPASSPTRLTGTVKTPGRNTSGTTWINQLPVPNALVYIPAEPSVALPNIAQGVTAGSSASCGRCADEKLVADGQSVLAAAVTDYKGDFTLEGRIPVGAAFKLVVKVGKWRRVVQVPATVAAGCASRALALDYTRLPSSSSDGLAGTQLPKIAISTGDVDAMECVLRNVGIAESEFTIPNGTGRIHMYRANGAMMPNSCLGPSSCRNNNNRGCRNNYAGCSWANSDTTLYDSANRLMAYDVVVFDCEGDGRYHRDATQLARLLAYVDAGGRMFASHWSYWWLDNNGTLDQAAAWNENGTAATGTGFVSLPSGPTGRARANGVKNIVFRDWLDWQGALSGTNAGVLDNPTTPQFPITDPRDVAGATVGNSTDEWVYRTTGSGPRVQQLSFNTPYSASESAICGRVAFSAFHVAATATGTTLDTSNLTFPAECLNSALTPQEKTLAFMLFDLATCVSAGDPPQAPSCTPKTTADVCPGANDACGYVSDGCGGVVDCAGCASGFYCDGNTCRPQQCTPSTCASLGYTCGAHADGCGGIARNAQGVEGCGTCAAGQTCGLTNVGQCGGCAQIPYASACPTNSCGQVSDGCGGTHDCGACATGVCGGGGANRCGSGTCTPIPIATACAGKTCGLVADGCGGTHSCGTCTAPDTCGGGGTPNVCGHVTCTPKTRDQVCSATVNCGYVSDGCGGAVNCGTCANNGVCGSAGPNQCGGSCTPTTCSAAGAECGVISDQCGSILSCGTCPTGQTCGATSPNKCGTGNTCTPTTCSAAGAECGLIGDGCGGVLSCGTCTSPETCGGAGVPNQCGLGTGGCNPKTCEQVGVICGQASDGCGGLLNCDLCPTGSYCNNGTCAAVPI